MAHLGLICPNTPGHLNPMTALAVAMRARGHRLSFFLLGDTPAAVTDAGFEVVPIGGSTFTPGEYRAWVEALGTLDGRAALKHTIAGGVRASEAILEQGPAAVVGAGVEALLVDQASLAGGTVADRLGMPFATVCNALLLHRDPLVPPYFTPWTPRADGWSRIRNRLAWTMLERLQAPILKVIRRHRRRLGLAGPRVIADTWSTRLQISQQPEAFEFPRRLRPDHLHFVGPLRVPGGYPPVDFPWELLDGRPLVYASLGTLQNRLAGAFGLIAAACAELEVQLVISTGRGVPAGALGELPGGPLVVPYAPQLELLARSRLAITHAGLNTVLDALSVGVPMVAVPVTNEQPGIAARVAWIGAGEVMPLARATPEDLRSRVDRVASEPGYRAAADVARAAIAAAGGCTRAAELLDQAVLAA